MNRTLIYIEDELLDLYPNTVIATTMQNADMTNLTTRNVSYTNRFTVPKTPNNALIFQNCDNIKSSSDVPYLKIPARVVQNGIEYPEAVAIVKETNGNYSIDLIFSAFWETIAEKLICDIDFNESITTWNAATIDSCRKVNSSVLLAPMDHYRKTFTGAWATIIVMPTVVLPSIKYKDIIETLIENAGYSYEGDIFDDPKYQAMAVAYSRPAFEYGGTFKKYREFKAHKVANQTVTNPGAGYEVVTFTNVIDKNHYGWYDAVTGEYEATGSDTRDFRVKFFVELSFEVTSGTYGFNISTSVGTILQGSATREYSVGRYNIGFSAEIMFDGTEGYEYNFGDIIQVRCEPGTPGACNILSGRYYNEVLGTNLQATNPTFYPNEILPDITQTDMMKDFILRFGLLVSERGNVLTFTRLTDLIKDRPNAIDLTDKRVDGPDRVKFTQSLSKENTFTYPGEDQDYVNQKANLKNNGRLILENETLRESSDFYTSIFNGSYTDTVSDGATEYFVRALIPIWESSATPTDYLTPFDNEPGNRLILLREKESDETDITYNGNVRADYLATYFNNYSLDGDVFVSEPFDYDLGWPSFIAENYQDLVPLLEYPKIVTRYYNISEIDLLKLDFQRLIYDDGVYFILQKVENFQPGKTSKFELFKAS